VTAAAKRESLPALAANSHRGHQLLPRIFHPAIAYSKPLNATGFDLPLYDSCVGPRCTGKLRDYESGLQLDYFGARYYGGAQGRFTTADPENASGFLYPDDPQSWNGYAYGRNNPLKFVDPDGLAYRVCQVGEDGKEFNCGTVKDDSAFEDYAKAQGWTLKSGKLLDQSGNVMGAAHYFNPEPMEALIAGTQRAGALIEDAAKTMAVNAAMTATGVVALRGLGYAGQAVQELGVFKNSKVVVNIAHQIMKVRPGHLPPPGSVADVQKAVEGAIQTGNYALKANGLIEGTTHINGVAVGFRGRLVDGVARIATVFSQR
jgi:RHS repeat-associated protein